MGGGGLCAPSVTLTSQPRASLSSRLQMLRTFWDFKPASQALGPAPWTHLLRPWQATSLPRGAPVSSRAAVV